MKKDSLRVIVICTFIAAAFIVCGLLFAYFSTAGLKDYLKEDTLEFSRDMTLSVMSIVDKRPISGEKAAFDDSVIISAYGDKTRSGIDICIIDDEGNIMASSGSGDEVGNIFEDETGYSFSEADLPAYGGFTTVWGGAANPFYLSETLFCFSCLEEDNAYLLIVNTGEELSTIQRRQYAAMAVFGALMLIVIIVLLTNMLSNYRADILKGSQKDPLTGILNRKAFMDRFYSMLAVDMDRDCCVYLLDIDYFKQINDTHGHISGDDSLRLVAKHLEKMSAEKEGYAGRWGGDEFIGVLRKSPDEARDILGLLCDNIRNDMGENYFPMTVSIGFTDIYKGMTIEDIYTNADSALYISKENGRNTVSFKKSVVEYAPESWSEASAVHNGRSKVSTGEIKKENTSKETSSQIIPLGFRDLFIRSMVSAVRRMIPFVAGGGILIALAFLFDAASIDLSALSVSERSQLGSITQISAVLKDLGQATLNFMLPVFAGFFAMELAGEEAFMSGFVGGFLLINSNSGFIGAAIAGFAAGFVTRQMKLFIAGLSEKMKAIAPVVIYPVINLLLMAALAFLIITPITTAAQGALTSLIDSTADNSVLSCVLSSTMMAVDMGGIINKAAYNYGVNAISSGNIVIMAAVMLGGMIPPAGVALSAMLFKNRFTRIERENAIVTLFMGLSFITEGVLPYVLTDPLRVIVACMAGSAMGGLLSGLFGCYLPAPHGGIFVVPLVGHAVLYLIAFAAGSFLTAILLGLMKKRIEIKE